MMEAEMVSKTLGFYPQLTWLVASENFVEFKASSIKMWHCHETNFYVSNVNYSFLIRVEEERKFRAHIVTMFCNARREMPLYGEVSFFKVCNILFSALRGEPSIPNPHPGRQSFIGYLRLTF
jgi:hypothetical protein